MSEDEKKEAAKDLMSSRLFDLVLTELETEAVNNCVSALYPDHEARQAYAAEVRAIRNFRERVAILAGKDQPRAGKTAPA